MGGEGGPRDADGNVHSGRVLWSFVVFGMREERLAGVLLGRLAELVERQQKPGKPTRTGGDAAGQAPLMVTEQSLATALWAVAVAGPGALAAHAREVGVLLREAARRWEQGGGRGPTVPFG